MRYFPMMLAAGLLSAGLLSGSGPAHALPALALDRSAVADTQVENVAYYHRQARRHYRRDITAMDIATDALWLWLPSDPTTVVMDMGVAGATERQEDPDLNLRVNRGRWRNLGKVAYRHRISPPRNPARVLRAWPGFFCVCKASSEPTNLMAYAETDGPITDIPPFVTVYAHSRRFSLSRLRVPISYRAEDRGRI